MSKTNENVLNEEFLAELYNSAITSNYMCSVVCQHMKDEFLPDKEYQQLNEALKKHFEKYRLAPKYTIIKQELASSRAMQELLDEIKETAQSTDEEAIRDGFENYLKLVQFKRAYTSVGKVFKDGEGLAAIDAFIEEAHNLQQFSLAPEEFVDVADTFEDRLAENKQKIEGESEIKTVNKFYIDGLDSQQRNRGQNLRTQLSVFLAMPGVGKSHCMRWIGYNAAYIDGLDVLHLQLEGSEAEVLNAYSACMANVETFDFERGMVSGMVLEEFKSELKKYAGTLKVRSWSKFGKTPSTMDIKNECDKYKEKFGKYPDIVLIDSIDLVTSLRRKYTGGSKDLRFERLDVMQDLKNLAAELNCWVAGSYQATIPDEDWVNDEKNVLGKSHLSEAKGVSRPITHLVSLNQSQNEEKENVMRIHVAKARFFKVKGTFKIATDFDHEKFYDKERTMNLPK